MKRRGLLLGLGALFAAPAIVRVASLMPVSVLKPEPLIVGMDLGAADASYIVVGYRKLQWDGKLWVDWKEPLVPHWSAALPQDPELRPQFTGQVLTTGGGPVPDNAQDAIQRVLDKLAADRRDADLRAWTT